MFFIEANGTVLAEMIYSEPQSGEMIIEHTEVDEELRGQNIGYELVHQAVEYARTHHRKIHSVCTFAAAILQKKPEFVDVLA